MMQASFQIKTISSVAVPTALITSIIHSVAEVRPADNYCKAAVFKDIKITST